MQTYNVYYQLNTEISQIFPLSASQSWATIGRDEFSCIVKYFRN